MPRRSRSGSIEKSFLAVQTRTLFARRKYSATFLLDKMDSAFRRIISSSIFTDKRSDDVSGMAHS